MVSFPVSPSLEHFYVCPSRTELQQLRDCALATRYLHHFVRAVSEKGFEPTREGMTVMYHGYWRDCGEISDQEVCFLAVLKSGGRFVQRIENDLVGHHQASVHDQLVLNH